mmetsp:Transcript_37607/g.89819  ORF Transcript_37607/g.89819 Transcript_37607/m.89819 type:complete len:910 (+) Transcript_37607:43-2772(+)|eukprot:CAMPEP_0181437758 /NCGR_PEP_ID=MMETSP1110-20121109/21551_1 /TAXON_ID=174948 /ORGANISM="Symbiodinium sp., Strain CCMP421" /LENGTH=909 /DNA_ID=CAMNT_0023561409 /DNA_START=41 /DNA_END=2770 /DNA_ORIENTATION=+
MACGQRSLAAEVATGALDSIYSAASQSVSEVFGASNDENEEEVKAEPVEEAVVKEELWEEPKAVGTQLEATISGDQLGHLLSTSHFQRSQGKELTISVDDAAARTLYAVAFAASNYYQQPQQLASDPMACQIYWPNNWQWQSNMPATPSPKSRKEAREGRRQSRNAQTMNERQTSPNAQSGQQHPLYQQYLWNQQQHQQYQQQQQHQQYHQHHNQQYFQPHQYHQHQQYQQHQQQQQQHSIRQTQQQQQEQEAPAFSTSTSVRLARKQSRVMPEKEEAEEAEVDAASQDGKAKAKPKTKVRPSVSKELNDLIVVSTRAGQPGDKAILECEPPEDQESEESEPPMEKRKTLLATGPLTTLSLTPLNDDDLEEEEEEEDKESDEVVEDKPVISHKQAQSVHLLGSLERLERRVGTAPAPHLALPRTSPRLRPRTSPFLPQTARDVRERDARERDAQEREARLKEIQERRGKTPRPEWDTSFYSMHQRRIPTYDALIDNKCPILSSPSRLRHIVETRDLPDAYLHIVRARFEQHRKHFDRDGKLGERVRPEPVKTETPEEYPERLVERLLSGFEADGIDTKVQPPGAAFSLDALGREAVKHRSAPKVSQQVLCSPEWQNSTLHEEVSDGVEALRIDLNDVEPTEQGTLAPSWKKMEGEIKLLWHRLQIPLDVRTEFDEGALAHVTPESLYQLQAHLNQMQRYETATRKLIKDWLCRDQLLEAVCSSHALGVNDQRLVKLKADVQKLDRLSCKLVSDIGAWRRHFAQLIVDVSRDPMVSPGRTPAPVFVWGGRDAIERIQSDAERLVRGDLSVFHQPNLSEQFASKAPGSEMGAENSLSTRFKDWGFASTSKSKGWVLPPCSLASATVAAQNFKVTDVLFEGPAPSWYRSKVAKAGIKALKRGLPCGGGDKRL